MTRDDKRADEKQRRDEAIREPGEVVEGSAEPIAPRSLPQMVSVRLEAELVSALRRLARDKGVSMSDLLRDGAKLVLTQAGGQRWTLRFVVLQGGASRASVRPAVYDGELTGAGAG